MVFRPSGGTPCRRKTMIRLRDIPLPPEHNAHQLQFEAAQMLHISVSKIRHLRIVRRSVDARKKPDIKIIYTIDVAVDGNEKRLLKQAGCKRATIAPVSYYKAAKRIPEPAKRPYALCFRKTSHATSWEWVLQPTSLRVSQGEWICSTV